MEFCNEIEYGMKFSMGYYLCNFILSFLGILSGIFSIEYCLWNFLFKIVILNISQYPETPFFNCDLVRDKSLPPSQTAPK